MPLPEGIFGSLRFRVLWAMFIIFIALSFASRLLIIFAFPYDFSKDLLNIAKALSLGGLNDLATISFAILPTFIILMLVSCSFYTRRAGRLFLQASLFIFVLSNVFSLCSEYLFWDEFHTRFNFIAVDYLIYTSEVVNNIIESYPIVWILLAIFVSSLCLTALSWKLLLSKDNSSQVGQAETLAANLPLKLRAAIIVLYCLVPCLIFYAFTPLNSGGDRYWKEVERNGVYELFSAFRHNIIDYRVFYPLIDRAEAFKLLQKELSEPNSSFVSDDPEEIRRRISATEPKRKLNVIIVVMESIGSKWLGEYAPNLVELSKKSLFFSDMHSTGTRTVRGLEAVALSVPPTPGSSIVRRLDNDGLFSTGSVFRQQGYDNSFIYGGYGYFDNMGAFFSGNGYRVVDKVNFTEEQKTFSTAWGQCDEDILGVSIAEADKQHAAGTPFHQVVLTTSNHRPFNYPEGKVALPPGISRRGAVQYADYAIGKFLAEATKKAWFEDTVFIFVGDHPSAIAGKSSIPTEGYKVPCIIYSPKYIAPQTLPTLCSQIDIAPTLFALLGWNYESQFFGRNIKTMSPEEGRAWVATYQLLGFMDTKGLTVLSPRNEPENFALENQAANSAINSDANKPAPNNLALELSTIETADLKAKLAAENAQRIKRAIVSYQCSYDLFKEGKLKELRPAP